MSIKRYAIICDSFIVFWGSWTLTQLLCLVLNLTFINMIWLGSGSLGATVCFMFFSSRGAAPDRMRWNEAAALFLFLTAAVFFTLCINRPDGDDEVYLAISASVLDYPDVALRLIPTKVFLSGYGMLSLELLKSALAHITGIPLLCYYYLIVPALCSVIVVLVHWQLLRLIILRGWILGIAFLFIVMLTWGDVHPTPANFGFVRLYQGKACFVSIIVPAIIFYFLKYAETYSRKYVALLLFAIIAGLGATPSAIIVEPLLVTVLAAGGLFAGRIKIRQLILPLSPLVIPVIMGILQFVFFNRERLFGIFPFPMDSSEHTTNYEMLSFVLGSGFRGIFALLCFSISPYFITNDPVKIAYRNYVLLCVILLLIPWTSETIAKLTHHTARWRWLWMIPFPAAMSIVIGRISIISHIYFPRPAAWIAVLLLSALFIAAPRPWIISHKNGARITWPAFKLYNQNRIFLSPYEAVAVIEDGYLMTGRTGKRF